MKIGLKKADKNINENMETFSGKEAKVVDKKSQKFLKNKFVKFLNVNIVYYQFIIIEANFHLLCNIAHIIWSFQKHDMLKILYRLFAKCLRININFT